MSLLALPDAFKVIFLIDTSTTPENDADRMSDITKKIIEKVRRIPRVLNFVVNYDLDDTVAINYGSKAKRIPFVRWMPNSEAELTVMGGKPDLENALRMAKPELEGGVPTLLVMLQTNTLPANQVESAKALLAKYKKDNEQLFVLAIGSELRNDTDGIGGGGDGGDKDDRLNLKKLQPSVDVVKYLETNDASKKDSFDQILPLVSKPLNSFRGRSELIDYFYSVVPKNIVNLST